MTITYSDSIKQEYENFKKNGGSITFEIDPKDISSARDFETSPSVQPKLTTGFELPPVTLINTPELQALIKARDSEWDHIFYRVYLSGGNVIYKQQLNGKYEATCNIPAA